MTISFNWFNALAGKCFKCTLIEHFYNLHTLLFRYLVKISLSLLPKEIPHLIIASNREILRHHKQHIYLKIYIYARPNGYIALTQKIVQ